MRYTKDNIQEYITREKAEYLFFWGHQPSKDGSIIKTCLSQWWPSPFTENGVTFKTAEHYMMAGKAKLFNDQEMFERIVAKESPKDVKDLGRQIRDFDADEWDKYKFSIVRQGNLLKFSQDEKLEDFLVKTGKKVIVEASPVDKIWGIGLAENDEDAKNPATWRGENLLGFALMEVRDELK